jgi:hypothetical protein
MSDGDVRNRIHARMAQWQATLAQLRDERTRATGEARRVLIGRLQELQAKIVEEVRQWNAGIDEYDDDPARTTQKEFEERAGLREIERQVSADLADWKKEDHGVG